MPKKGWSLAARKAALAARRRKRVGTNPYSTIRKGQPVGKKRHLSNQRIAVRDFGVAGGMTSKQRDTALRSIKRRRKISGAAIAKRHKSVKGRVKRKVTGKW